ncbi:MAG: MGMT family protein [Candidatus Andersenbacteria bacterium]|nr:MGMT family protein [bacterium]MDZ4225670.1 MGMT family protein [Candidatus Andersenbacteria bacterium]
MTSSKQQVVSSKGEFTYSVLSVVSGIPVGHVMTYREVAAAAGRPRAWRAVGNILHKNYDPAVPCHRVVGSDGKIGGYNRGKGMKRKLLAKEGVLA